MTTSNTKYFKVENNAGGIVPLLFLKCYGIVKVISFSVRRSKSKVDNAQVKGLSNNRILSIRLKCYTITTCAILWDGTIQCSNFLLGINYPRCPC